MTEKLEHKNIHAALTAAQAVMKSPEKNADNPAFKRDGKPMKYADLVSVVDSVRKPLTDNGISWHWQTVMFGDHMAMECVLSHGQSGTSLSCPVPLFVDRQNMHGLKSAYTYARRIGLEAVTGQAPSDDDDGNAATDAAPKAAPTKPQTINAQQFIALRDLIEGSAADESRFLAAYGAASLEQFPLNRYAEAVAALNRKIEQARAADLGGDSIPHHGG